MKQNICIALLGLFLLVSCSNKPGDAFLNYANKAVDGNYEGFAAGFCKKGKKLDAAEDSLNRVLMQDYREYLDKNYGGLQSVEVVRDSIYDDGLHADIRVLLRFKDETAEETEYVMTNVDGKWMIELAL